jgi:DNA-binding MarR family transcriptional regulator
MPPKPKPHTREAGAALAAAAPLATRWVERVLASHDPPLTVAQYLALRAVAGEPVSGSQLAQRAGVSAAAVSQLVSALEQQALLERSTGADRRTRDLALTTKGAATLKSATALVGERLAELLIDLPRPEADALTRSLERVEAALTGTAPPKRRPHPPKRTGGRRAGPGSR